MKRLSVLFVALVLFSCASKSKVSSHPLYEVLTEQSTGGANFRFYEILTESKEITMLLGDPHLKGKIQATDINTSNFVILNMGTQSSGGYLIKVKSVEETADKIIIVTEDSNPKGNSISVISYPYTIVKINSKKTIEVK
jgi:hypothetical protein